MTYSPEMYNFMRRRHTTQEQRISDRHRRQIQKRARQQRRERETRGQGSRLAE